MDLHGEGRELLAQLSPEQIDELVCNTEVTALILHSKRWKYYALCNLPYSALKVHRAGRYDWMDLSAGQNNRYFENRVVRLRKEYLEQPK